MAMAGMRIKAVDFSEAKTKSDTNAQNDQTSTSFIAGSPEVGETFVPPTSGMVEIVIGGRVQDNGGTSRGLLQFEVYEGTSAAGTPIITAPNTQYELAIRGVGTAGTESSSRSRIVEGLAPGVDHYARVVHAVSAGTTVDFAARTIDIIPVH